MRQCFSSCSAVVGSAAASELYTNLRLACAGDNLVIGSYDNKLTWFDMDLSTKPYRTLR